MKGIDRKSMPSKYKGWGGLDIIALSIFSSDAKALRLSAEPFSLFVSSLNTSL
jgi:hypothetical protein